jgi:chemotaxis protein methyltransferase WspC
MPLSSIELLLKQRMGLHSATVGSVTVRQAVEQRMRSCDIHDTGDYLKILQHSATELDALIDTVIIPETWFFRDRNPFSAFSAWVTDEWWPRNAGHTLRVLSVPCSSGEEPYTLAMCLCDIGLPATATHIDAVDISHTNIEKALRATYGSNSFRGGELDFRERHFASENQRYQLKDNIRCRVSFVRANILDDGFLQKREPYHVIFCRNLLIYFDRPTQNSAIERLEHLLTGDGVLFLGHSETSLVTERDFTPLGYPRSFAFRRGKTVQREQSPPRRKKPVCTIPKKRQEPPPGREKRQKPPSGPATVKPVAEVAPATTPDNNESLLKQAFRLADQGHIDEAAQHCETLLKRNCHQADAHYLLGLIRETTGNRRAAEQHLRKAVYLDPNHYEALTHLGVICLQHGDTAGARRFQERAGRVQQRTRPTEKSE